PTHDAKHGAVWARPAPSVHLVSSHRCARIMAEVRLVDEFFVELFSSVKNVLLEPDNHLGQERVINIDRRGVAHAAGVESGDEWRPELGEDGLTFMKNAQSLVLEGKDGQAATLSRRRAIPTSSHATVEQALLRNLASAGRSEGERFEVLQAIAMGDGETRVRSLRDRRRRSREGRETAIARVQARQDCFIHLVGRNLAGARVQGLLQSRRLLSQSEKSSRRLQELFHECLGEYEKARLRGVRRDWALVDDKREELRARLDSLRWARFCARLENDALGLVEAKDLGPRGPNRGAFLMAAARVAPFLSSGRLAGSQVVRVIAVKPVEAASLSPGGGQWAGTAARGRPRAEVDGREGAA
ncbi:unnamed protein product, partial [Discosporangium mesarthrocarpum]